MQQTRDRRREWIPGPVLRGLALLTAGAALALAGCASSGPSGGPDEGPAPAAEGPPPAQGPLTAADSAALRVEEVRIRPDELTIRVGEGAEVEVTALDSAGNEVEGVELEHFVQGGATYVAETGRVETSEPGEATFFAGRWTPATPGREADQVFGQATITITPLAVERIELGAPEGPVYVGTRAQLTADAFSPERPRPDAGVTWSSGDTSVAVVSPHGLVQGRSVGTTRITAVSEGVSAEVEVRVTENPVRELTVEAPESGRVGDVLHLRATALDAEGAAVEDAPVEWSVEGPDGAMSERAYLDDEGRFVAEARGLYRVTATVGDRSGVAQIEAMPRPDRREMEVVGHAPVEGHATSDLWVFEGVDGRDYAYTGTHAAGAGGNVLYAWDVTDPAEPTLTDSVVVDARVVNDVKINQTRNLAVITREGASNRQNGIVLLDSRAPAHPRVVSSFTENLTAGVHNTWIEGELVYAVNNGTRALHIVDISDPTSPAQVGRWQIDDENRTLHDVIVQDGLAYLSYWDHGLVILDVGAGVAGGTPTEPVEVSRHAYRTRWGAETYGNTHHAIPYGDYVFVGDEIFGCSECVNGPRGHVHVIDVSDLENPEEVAWYRVPEAGAHNQWVEDGKLYVAYYQGGLRVVDVTGELRGDLYAQDREIGWYMTGSSEGFVPNSTMSWGPQPHDGLIYVADMNSGLWILRFADEAGDG
jgi:hypothetical protein